MGDYPRAQALRPYRGYFLSWASPNQNVYSAWAFMKSQLPPALQIGFLLMGLQACQAPLSQTDPAPTPPVEASTPTESAPATEPLPILLNPVLPAFTAADLTQLTANLTTGIESWFALAGLNKAVPPPALPEDLQAYRQTWEANNPEIAPFLGLWHDSEAQNFYYLSLFPSTVPQQVCVLEFKPEWSLAIWNEEAGDYSYKDVISEQTLSFSVATVEADQLRSSQIRTTTAALTRQTFALSEPYSVELIGIEDDQGTQRVLAATALPMLPPDFPAALQPEVLQALADHDCIPEPP